MTAEPVPPSRRPALTPGSGRPGWPRTRTPGCATGRPGDHRLPRGRERLRRRLLRRAGRGRDGRHDLRRDQVAGPGDRPVGAGAPRRLVVRHPHDRGRDLPGVLPQPGSRGARHARLGDARLQRRGRRASSSSTCTPSTPSPDHTLLAWSCDTDGSEHYTLRIRDLVTGADLPDELTDTSSWGGVAWSARPVRRGSGCSTPGPTTRCARSQIWRHRLGSPVDDDVLVMAEPDERFYLGVETTRSERWIVVAAASKTSGEAWVIPADDPTGAPRLVRARGPTTSSTASTTGATASSSSPTSTPPTSG